MRSGAFQLRKSPDKIHFRVSRVNLPPFSSIFRCPRLAGVVEYQYPVAGVSRRELDGAVLGESGGRVV